MPGKLSLAGLILTVLAVALAPLASSGDSGDGRPSGKAASEPKEVARAETEFGWDVALGAGTVPGLPAGRTSLGIGGAVAQLRLQVPDGVAELRLEAEWGCLTPTCAATFSLYPPGATDSSVGPVSTTELPEPAGEASGNGKAGLVLASPQAGEWLVLVGADSPSVQATGTMSLAAYA